jgi:hypothetical protein
VPGKIYAMHIALFHVDAFTEHAFSGNPAAVCFLDFWLDDALLGKVAAENNMGNGLCGALGTGLRITLVLANL